MRFRLTGVILPAVIAVGCAGDVGRDEARAVVSDSAGVRIVENPAPDRPLEWSPVKLADLMTPDSALTAVPWGVAADPAAGRVYVLDWTGEWVVAFDRSGEYAGTYGRRGGGPGEFRDPSALSLGPDGALTVWDGGRGVLSRWSAAGELLDERRAPVALWGPGFHQRREGIVTVVVREREREQRQLLIGLVAGDTTVLHTVPRELVMVELPCMSQPMHRIFAPDIVWTARGDTVFVLNGPDYRIDTYTDGTLASSVRRSLEPLRVTERMAAEWARLRHGRFMRRCGVTPEQLVTEVGHEELASPVQRIAVDPDGRFWVTRSSNGLIPDRVDVLDADDRYRGTMDAPAMPVGFLSATRFVGLVVRPETGRTILSLYDVRAAGDRTR